MLRGSNHGQLWVNRMEGGKGLTCALFRVIWKVLCLGSKAPHLHEGLGCHSPSLGFTTKARACKGASQE
jgi:hypothetical protein